MKLHLLTYFAITFSLRACVDVMITLFIKNYNGIDTLSDVSVHLCKTGALQLEIRAYFNNYAGEGFKVPRLLAG